MSDPKASRVFDVSDVRRVAAQLAGALRSAGVIPAAVSLERAVAFRSLPAEELLELRSVLVSTRPLWEAHVPQALRDAGSRTLRDAKRLAIEMP